MDRTLKPAKRSNKRRKDRNEVAWDNSMGPGNICIFCGHSGNEHLMSSGQPHFFRPATKAEIRDGANIYYHYLDEKKNTYLYVRKILVAAKPELITCYCQQCAREKDTDQVMCFQRTLAKGELVGLETADYKIHKSILEEPDED